MRARYWAVVVGVSLIVTAHIVFLASMHAGARQATIALPPPTPEKMMEEEKQAAIGSHRAVHRHPPPPVSATHTLRRRTPAIVVEQRACPKFTGGPEALILMLLAAGPSSYATRDPATCHPVFRDTYPSILQHRVRGKRDLARWRAGDVLILPEQASCPAALLAKGVKVYIWLLGAVGPGLIAKKKAQGCKFLAHSFWLSTAYAASDGLRLPPTSVIRPYFAPAMVALARSDAQARLRADPAAARVRSDVVLLNHDLSRRAKEKLGGVCARLTCTMVVGFTREQLVDLFRSAKVIVGWCMRGAEKTVVEAALFGVHVVTSTSCMNDADARDFPVPASHRAADAAALPGVVDRAVARFEADRGAFEPLRRLYFSLDEESMADEVRRWMAAEGLL